MLKRDLFAVANLIVKMQVRTAGQTVHSSFSLDATSLMVFNTNESITECSCFVIERKMNNLFTCHHRSANKVLLLISVHPSQQAL